jgi:hypothetical protein
LSLSFLNKLIKMITFIYIQDFLWIK